MDLHGVLAATVFFCGFIAITEVWADPKPYDPGVSDTEIRIGQTMPYSGPASSFAVIGRTEAAYFRMVNEHGGVNGRQIILFSLDDGYLPPRTVEQTRRLVERERVLAIFGSLGTPTNSAVQKYLNERGVPQLFILTGAVRFADPQQFPWTMALALSQHAEAGVHARFILATQPEARIGVLYQNDDYGREYLDAFKVGLGAKAATMIVKEVSYEVQDPTIDQQIAGLREAKADVLLDIAIPRFAAQAIRRVHNIGWDPLHLISQPAMSVAATLRPAGLDKSVGLIGAEIFKAPNDPAWAGDPEVTQYLEFMSQYFPRLDPDDRLYVGGYVNAAAVVELLRLCGDDLTRKNLIWQASHMKDWHVPLLLPGITLNTSPVDYAPIKQMQLQRFDGVRWVPISDVSGG